MEFIKRNYEKIILSLVLLGLVGALGFMPVLISLDKQKVEDVAGHVINPRVDPLPELDLSRQQAVLDRMQSPYKLDLTTTNKLFNPVQWVREKDNSLIKIQTGNEVGPGAAVVTKITPLYFIITLDSVSVNELGAHYAISIEDQSAAIPGQRRKRPHTVSMVKGDETVVDKAVSGKNEGFKLTGVKGPPENPDQLVLKLADTGAEVTVSKDKPFRRVDVYAADLKYARGGENYSRTGLRVGDRLTFANDDYNVIAIDQNEVILLAQSNQKKYILPYAP